MSDPFHKLVAAGPNPEVTSRKVGKSSDLAVGYGGAVQKYAEQITGLTFNALRAASEARTPVFKNAAGEIAHSGTDWTLNDWFTAMVGEVGETGNLLKKVRRRDFDLADIRDELASELADVVIYLDLLANKAGIDLGEAVMKTFNAKSEKLQLDLFLTPSGPVTHPLHHVKAGADYKPVPGWDHFGNPVPSWEEPADETPPDSKISEK